VVMFAEKMRSNGMVHNKSQSSQEHA